LLVSVNSCGLLGKNHLFVSFFEPWGYVSKYDTRHICLVWVQLNTIYK
jgi:hypothetical protein